jgi:hypothetical protein
MNPKPVIVHVNQHVIKHNAKHGTKLPTLTIKHPADGGRSTYAHEVEGFGRTVDCNAQGRKPLSCGARVWMEYMPTTFLILGETMDFPTLKAAMGASA